MFVTLFSYFNREKYIRDVASNFPFSTMKRDGARILIEVPPSTKRSVIEEGILKSGGVIESEEDGNIHFRIRNTHFEVRK